MQCAANKQCPKIESMKNKTLGLSCVLMGNSGIILVISGQFRVVCDCLLSIAWSLKVSHLLLQ